VAKWAWGVSEDTDLDSDALEELAGTFKRIFKEHTGDRPYRRRSDRDTHPTLAVTRATARLSEEPLYLLVDDRRNTCAPQMPHAYFPAPVPRLPLAKSWGRLWAAVHQASSGEPVPSKRTPPAERRLVAVLVVRSADLLLRGA
jgi:hypothetical protein